MAQWHPGRVIVLKENSDSRVRRFFSECEVAWVIASHSGFVYVKVTRPVKGDFIMRCLLADMGKYFTAKLFHDEMPYVNGPFRDIKIFPDDFFSITKSKERKDPPMPNIAE